VASNGNTFIIKCSEIRPEILGLKHADGPADKHDLPYICPVYAHLEKNAEKEWSSSLGVGRWINILSQKKKKAML
jgi:hypothetical protein